MTESQMLEAFSSAVEAAGGVRGFARLAEVSPSFVSNALRGGVAVSPRLLYAAGIERVVTFQRLVDRTAPQSGDDLLCEAMDALNWEIGYHDENSATGEAGSSRRSEDLRPLIARIKRFLLTHGIEDNG